MFRSLILATLDDTQGSVNLPRDCLSRLTSKFRALPLFGLIGILGFGCVTEPATPLLRVVGTRPESGERWAAGEPIRVYFDQYLDPTADWRGAAEIFSNDLQISASIAYDPVDRALVIIPRIDLVPNLGYRLTVFADRVQGYGGQQMSEDLVLDFVSAKAARRIGRPKVSFADVAPIFTEKCGCHGPDVFPALTTESLFNVRSQRHPDRLLVSPGRPLQSHLIERLLPNYPGVWGRTMPPNGGLTDHELRLIISWVGDSTE